MMRDFALTSIFWSNKSLVTAQLDKLACFSILRYSYKTELSILIEVLIIYTD